MIGARISVQDFAITHFENVDDNNDKSDVFIYLTVELLTENEESGIRNVLAEFCRRDTDNIVNCDLEKQKCKPLYIIGGDLENHNCESL